MEILTVKNNKMDYSTFKKIIILFFPTDYSLVIAPVVAELCTTSVALSAPPNSYQNNSQS